MTELGVNQYNKNVQEPDFNKDERIVRRKGYFVPFGWMELPENTKYLVPIPKELKAIKLAIQFRDTGEYSWTELAAWLHKVTGRKISHMGIKHIYLKAKEKQNGVTSTQETNTSNESQSNSSISSSENTPS